MAHQPHNTLFSSFCGQALTIYHGGPQFSGNSVPLFFLPSSNVRQSPPSEGHQFDWYKALNEANSMLYTYERLADNAKDDFANNTLAKDALADVIVAELLFLNTNPLYSKGGIRFELTKAASLRPASTFSLKLVAA